MLLRSVDTLLPGYTVPHPSYLHNHSRMNLKTHCLFCWKLFLDQCKFNENKNRCELLYAVGPLQPEK
jgi:hypothetical protein